MQKIDLFLGIIIGFVTTVLGMFIFIEFFTDFHFIDGIKNLKENGFLGKLITLGAVLNIIAFFILLKVNRELMARGVVLSTIVLTLITLLV